MSIARRSIVGAVIAIGLAAGIVAETSTARSSDAVRTVEITIEHSLFVPDSIDVRPGETVRFVITNDDPIDHEFLIGDETVQSAHENGTEPHHGEKPGEISVPADGTEETTYTFPHAGYTIFGCHLPGHYDYGMKGLIVIS